MDAPEISSSALPTVLDVIGRQEELAQLGEVWRLARDERRPQVAIVEGNVGVGKTRLVGGWLERVQGTEDAPRIIAAHAVPDDLPYGVIGRFLRRRFGLGESSETSPRLSGAHLAVVDPDAAEDRIDAVCREIFGDAHSPEIPYFLGSFMALRFGDNPFLRLLEDDPLQHDNIANTVLRRFVEADARCRPLIIVCEDLQYADDASLDLLHDLGATLDDTPLLLVLVSRPGLGTARPGWAMSDGNVTRLDLGPLRAADAAAYVRAVLAPVDRVPAEFVDDAVEMSGGNPLLINQLLRMLIDKVVLDVTASPWRLDLERFQETELPLSVEDAIRARIMALSVEERSVLEKAATVGNVFWFGALVVLGRVQIEEKQERAHWQSDEVAQRIRHVLDELVRREYVTKLPDSWIPGEEEYVFNHALEHKMILATTHPDTRQRFHLFVAQWADLRLEARTDEYLEFLAGHYEKGGDAALAAQYYIMTADAARARYANDQAIRCYSAALDLLDAYNALPRIAVLHNLGDVCALVGRNHEALDYFAEMLRLSWLIDAVSKGGAALGRIARVYRTLGEYDKAMERYRTALRLFEQVDDQRGVAATYDDIGKVHWLRGEYEEALGWHEKALDIRQDANDERSTAFTLGNMAIVYRDTGRFEEALAAMERSLAIQREVGDRPGVVASCIAVGGVFRDLGRDDKAEGIWNEARQIAEQIGDRLQQAQVLCHLGDARRRRGDHNGAREQIAQAVAIASNLGDLRLLATCDRVLGRMALDTGDLDGAQERLENALQLGDEGGYLAEVGKAERALAEVASRRGRHDEAVERFERALGIFSEMGHHLEVAHCCEAMASFHARIGNEERATQLHRSAQDILARLRGAATAPR